MLWCPEICREATVPCNGWFVVFWYENFLRAFKLHLCLGSHFGAYVRYELWACVLLTCVYGLLKTIQQFDESCFYLRSSQGDIYIPAILVKYSCPFGLGHRGCV